MKGFAKSKVKRKSSRPVQQTLPGVEIISEPPKIQTQAGQGLLSLNFETHEVRVEIIDGDVWWVASDVCGILGIEHTGRALSRLDDDERGLTTAHTPGGDQQVSIVNEAGLWNLILASRKPEAKRFRRWLTHEVLPKIRRTGSYSLFGPTDRVKKKMKQLGVSEELAVRRVENTDLNVGLSAKGQSPHASVIHNAIYQVQFGKTAAAMRQDLGQRTWETPLDRMGLHPITQNNYIKSLAETKMAAKGTETKDRLSVYEDTARQVVDKEKELLGDSHGFTVRDDPKRGKIIDVGPVQITTTQAPQA